MIDAEYLQALKDRMYTMEDKIGHSSEEQATMCGFNYGIKYAIALFEKMNSKEQIKEKNDDESSIIRKFIKDVFDIEAEGENYDDIVTYMREVFRVNE